MNNGATKPDDEASHLPATVPSVPLPPEVLQLERSNPKAFAAVSQYILQVAVHSGPLPSPQALAGYDKASPGAALEIIGMAKAEQATRHYCVRAEVDAIKRGQVCAIFAFGLAMAASCVIAYLGAPIAACTLGSTAITVFGGAFFLARHLGAKQDRDDMSKQPPASKKQQKKKR